MLSWERCDANEVQVQEDFSSWTQVCPPLSLFTWDIDRDRGENGFTSMRVTSLVPFRIFESSLHHYYYHCYVSSGFLPSLLMSHDHAENKCLAFSFNWGINQNNDAADDDELAEAWMGAHDGHEWLILCVISTSCTYFNMVLHHLVSYRTCEGFAWFHMKPGL